MVGIVIVSHSDKVAEGIKEIAHQMSPKAKIATAGGTCDGRLGTEVEKIFSAICQVYSDDGVIILFDLGSAFMNAEMAIEVFSKEMSEKIEIADGALIEGAITAAVEAGMGRSRVEIIQALRSVKLGKV
ncbi:MAG: dihydroxyacetone kinase phosphoryl donor subunit DhaM [Clostridiaceae bacterium]